MYMSEQSISWLGGTSQSCSITVCIILAENRWPGNAFYPLVENASNQTEPIASLVSLSTEQRMSLWIFYPWMTKGSRGDMDSKRTPEIL